jgi:hypothetical protein
MVRLWHFHPKYLDVKGFCAQWFEAYILLGKLMEGKRHSQLKMIMESKSPITSLQKYMLALYKESKNRGYSFDINLIGPYQKVGTKRIPLEVNHYLRDWNMYKKRVEKRNPEFYKKIKDVNFPEPNPIFQVEFPQKWRADMDYEGYYATWMDNEDESLSIKSNWG